MFRFFRWLFSVRRDLKQASDEERMSQLSYLIHQMGLSSRQLELLIIDLGEELDHARRLDPDFACGLVDVVPREDLEF